MAFNEYSQGSDRDLAPAPRFPEKYSPSIEQKGASNSARRGPLRFEEGIATDTDVPSDFVTGAMSGYETAPGRPNHNANVWIKTPGETLRARAHVGSAAWVDAPTHISEFSSGADVNANSARRYEQVNRGAGLGQRYMKVNPTVVTD